MSEPILELPQVSLGRYLDLLKRRRWQVIPVSLLGLAIGGTVAFFIPRYYVADTRIDYSHAGIDVQQAAGQEDPFKFVVDNATIMLPQAVEAAMKKLGWPQSLERDPSHRRELARDVEERVAVLDLNPQTPHRQYASLYVTYRDTDGVRSAEFLNALVDTWMQQRLGEMRQQVEAQNLGASQRMTAALEEYNQVSRDLTVLEQQHGFLRLADPGVQREELRLRVEELQRRTTKFDETEREVATLQKRLENLQKDLDGTDRTLAGATGGLLLNPFPPGSKQFLWYAEREERKNSLDNVMGPTHPDRSLTLARIQYLEERLGKIDEGQELANPRVAELRTAMAATREQLAAATALRDRLQAEVEAEQERQRQRVHAEDEYNGKLRALAEAQKKREAANEQLQAALRVQEQLDSAPPIKQVLPALVPKRPTEPNILLVAVLGCVIGLGAAIGLILAIDFLQGTLKTVDDVERALPVPVLGGVSHLETREDRARASASRRRASLVAGMLLVGAVVVVTTYYVAPHRLPPVARDLLSMVLGG